MFVRIRNMPQSGANGQWIAPGFQNQFGQEVQVVSFTCEDSSHAFYFAGQVLIYCCRRSTRGFVPHAHRGHAIPDSPAEATSASVPVVRSHSRHVLGPHLSLPREESGYVHLTALALSRIDLSSIVRLPFQALAVGSVTHVKRLFQISTIYCMMVRGGRVPERSE